VVLCITIFSYHILYYGTTEFMVMFGYRERLDGAESLYQHQDHSSSNKVNFACTIWIIDIYNYIFYIESKSQTKTHKQIKL
jgi:hypothetical protein